MGRKEVTGIKEKFPFGWKLAGSWLLSSRVWQWGRRASLGRGTGRQLVTFGASGMEWDTGEREGSAVATCACSSLLSTMKVWSYTLHTVKETQSRFRNLHISVLLRKSLQMIRKYGEHFN